MPHETSKRLVPKTVEATYWVGHRGRRCRMANAISWPRRLTLLGQSRLLRAPRSESCAWRPSERRPHSRLPSWTTLSTTAPRELLTDRGRSLRTHQRGAAADSVLPEAFGTYGTDPLTAVSALFSGGRAGGRCRSSAPEARICFRSPLRGG